MTRVRESRPVVDRFFAWCAEQAPTALDDTPLARAIGYAMNQRAALERFLDDGRLPLRNNASENALRRQVLGRRNWLFVGNDDAAEVNATFVSLLASCRLHGIEPWDALVPSDTSTVCAYKGSPRTGRFAPGGQVHRDLVWFDPEPRHDALRVANYLRFFNERVDLAIDGDLQPRPRTPWSPDAGPEYERVEAALRWTGSERIIGARNTRPGSSCWAAVR